MVTKNVSKLLFIYVAFAVFLLANNIPLEAQSGDSSNKRLDIDRDQVESISVDVSTETQKTIAFLKNGKSMVFDSFSKKLMSETLPNGDIKDHINNELIKATNETNIYNVYKKDKFLYKIEFLKDGGQNKFDKKGTLIQHIDKDNTKRYLKKILKDLSSDEIIVLFFKWVILKKHFYTK